MRQSPYGRCYGWGYSRVSSFAITGPFDSLTTSLLDKGTRGYHACGWSGSCGVARAGRHGYLFSTVYDESGNQSAARETLLDVADALPERARGRDGSCC